MSQVYLKPNIIFEPLINQWYAWPYLIPPIQYAMFATNLHIPIMESYLSNPELHQKAVKDSLLAGGPFIDYTDDQTELVRELLSSIKRNNSKLSSLATAVKQTNELLINCNGAPLEPLYQELPRSIRGYVELVYDENQNAVCRYIEPLLYKSQYDNRSSQCVALSAVNNDNRSFVLSTPALKSEDKLFINKPFDSDVWNILAKSREIPINIDEAIELFNVKDDEKTLFSSFFEDTKKHIYSESNQELKIDYLGHACLLIQCNGISIIIDPVLSYNFPTDRPRATIEQLPKQIDYVLLTHNHQDHVMLETLLQIRHKVKNVIVPKTGGGRMLDPSLKLILEHVGFRNIYELELLERIPLKNGYIEGVPFLGEHADLDIQSKIAFMIKFGNKKILCMADSNNIQTETYEIVREHTGSADILFIGMECDGAPLSWLYGPLLTKSISRKTDHERRLNGSDYESACELVDIFNPQKVYIYAMGQEPWLSYLMRKTYTNDSKPIIEANKLIQYCTDKKIYAELLYWTKNNC